MECASGRFDASGVSAPGRLTRTICRNLARQRVTTDYGCYGGATGTATGSKRGFGRRAMNNLQLFRMYQRFRRACECAEESRRFYYRQEFHPLMGIAVAKDEYAREWQKWNKLGKSAATELERRLTPPTEGSLQHFNDAVSYWAQPTLYAVPKKGGV